MWDVLIVGGGPAGLNAALILGRCRRRVLVCDAGRPRNAASRGLHGFLSRDGILPGELLRIGREQLRQYETVELRDTLVTDGCQGPEGFTLTLADGGKETSRKLLLATGVVDYLPPVEGIEQFYGRSVFHCPYCDGWEMRDQPLAVYGKGREGVGLARELLLWSRDVVLCTDGVNGLSDRDRRRLDRHGISVRPEHILRLEGTEDGVLERIVFSEGEPLPRRAIFFNTGQHQRSPLALKLGCDYAPPRGAIKTGKRQVTKVPGLYVAGDAARDVQLAVVAAAEGAQAAFAINTELLKEDLARGAPSAQTEAARKS